MIQHDTTLDIQIPPEKVVLCMFGGPNTISTGVWMFRAMFKRAEKSPHGKKSYS